MNKTILISSNQAGPFSNANKMIDIQIPQGMLVDMSKSFLQLECEIELGPDAVGEVDGVSYIHNLGVRNIAYDDYISCNVELFKNVWLRSAKKGNLVYTPEIGVLGKNLFEMTKSSSAKIATPNSLYQLKTFESKMLMSPFVEMHKTGSISSRYRHCFLNTPLSEIIPAGLANEILSTDDLGALTLHLELDDLNRFEVKKLGLTQDVDGGCENVPTAGGNVLTLKLKYDSLTRVPFFVGEKVKITATTTADPPVIITPQDAVITEISYNQATGLVNITTNYTFPALTGVIVYGTVVIAESVEGPSPAPDYGSFKILLAQLGASLVQGPAPMVNQLNYMTFTTFQESVDLQSYSRIVEIEPECVSLFIMFQDPGTSASTRANKLSNNVNVKSYRIRIDNEDVYDRDILVNYTSNNAYTHDPAYHELLNRLFLNSGLPLKNFNCVALARDAGTLNQYYDEAGNQILILGCPTPMTPRQKQVQININCTDGQQVKNLIMYKLCVRSLKM
jgi:hypothetical protein